MNKIVVIKTRHYGLITLSDFKASDVIVLERDGKLDRETPYLLTIALRARGLVGGNENIMRFESPAAAVRKLELVLQLGRWTYSGTEAYAAMQRAISQLDKYVDEQIHVVEDDIVALPTRTIVVKKEPTIFDTIEDVVDVFAGRPRRTREVVFC